MSCNHAPVAWLRVWKQIGVALSCLEVGLEGLRRSFTLLRGACRGCRDAEVNVGEVKSMSVLVLLLWLAFNLFFFLFDFNVPLHANDVHLPYVFSLSISCIRWLKTFMMNIFKITGKWLNFSENNLWCKCCDIWRNSCIWEEGTARC